MSRADKLLDKIRNSPKTVAFSDLAKVLLQLGFERRQPRSGSSHYVFTYGPWRLTVPYRRPHISQVYVKQALELIDQILQNERPE